MDSPKNNNKKEISGRGKTRCQSYKKVCVCSQKTAEIQKLAKTNLRAYYEGMKDWGRNREKCFSEEGWRKMKAHN